MCRGTVFIDGLFSLASYANPVIREAIRAWKYDCDRDVEGLIERWVRQRFSARAFAKFDAVTSVPLHKTKHRARGFDQAEHFAQMISTVSGLPYKELLIRDKKTPAQANISEEKRCVGRLDGAFSCIKKPPQRILLCDDVFTSGATMDAAAKTLTTSGVGKIWGCVIARGG